jgi:phosphoenolpyruvate-protein kinase (PTS system EI component)
LAASGGSLSEVQRARARGFFALGLVRTEVLFLLENELPGLDTLTEHYRALLSEAGPMPVSLRLLDVTSALAPSWMNFPVEANPALGLAGVRFLLENGSVLRRQLAAVLCAAAEHSAQVEILIPLIVDCGELRAVKEVLLEERYELRRKGVPHCSDLAVGVIIETPAAVIGASDLAHEASSIVIAVDSLQQYLLATDRDHTSLAECLERLHPFLLRAVADLQDAALEAGTPLAIWGPSLANEESLRLLLGLGLTRLVVPPSEAEEVAAIIRSCDLESQRLATQTASSQSTSPNLAPPPPDAR